MSDPLAMLIDWAQWLMVAGVLLAIAAAIIAFARPGSLSGHRRPQRSTHRDRGDRKPGERGSVRTWRRAA